TPEPTLRVDRARVLSAARERAERRRLRDRDRGRAVGAAAVAELTGQVRSPAPDRAGRGARAAVELAAADLGDRAEPARLRDRHRLPAGRGGAIAELAAGVAPPAPRGLVAADGARVRLADAHAQHIRERGYFGRRARGLVRAVPDLAGKIVAPAVDRARRRAR